jgi:hypothetical protein
MSDKKGGSLGASDYDKLNTKDDGSQHRYAGNAGDPRDQGTHIVRQDGANTPITYARVNGEVLTQEQLDKINKA